MFYYADIPDEWKIKPYLPVMPILWQFYQELGWKRTTEYFKECQDSAYDFFEDRLNESIKTSELVFKGKIKEPDKVLSYVISIPPVTIRSDLVQGTTKLLGGDSFDVTWVALDDVSQEIFILLNAHCEDGIPVDWWMVRSEDELLDRRHMKLGYKTRNLPIRMKNFNKTAMRLFDVLTDIRNERTPWWAKSDYTVSIVWVSYAVELFLQGSNYETLTKIFDGWAARELYGLPDYIFSMFSNLPSVLGGMFYGGKQSFVSKITQLTTGGHLYYQPIEERTLKRHTASTPEIFDILKRRAMDNGVPLPIQSLNSTMPNIKKKSEPDTRFVVKYPDKNFINVEDMGLTFDELIQGVYFDITVETQPGEKFDESRVLSKGIGSKTKFTR
ncbi:MAG: hypothetical protein HWN66_11825 [Candidatus Helarchaeota archaeon]|nr:hypothetical protein [Candidatus Helarchaeota archaeon]